MRCRVCNCLPPSGFWRIWWLLSGLLAILACFDAWLDLAPQFRWVPFSGAGQILNCLLIQPHCCSVQWDGIIIILPKDRCGGKQLVVLHNEWQHEADFLLLCKKSTSLQSMMHSIMLTSLGNRLTPWLTLSSGIMSTKWDRKYICPFNLNAPDDEAKHT